MNPRELTHLPVAPARGIKGICLWRGGGARHIASSFDEAEEALMNWSLHYPPEPLQETRPVVFGIEFGNGIVWNGRFHLLYGGTDHRDRLLREAVHESLLYASGTRKPANLTRKAYVDSLGRLGLAVVLASRRILADCDFPETGN